MPKLTEDVDEQVRADVSVALEEKIGAMEAAIEDAPDAVHAAEHAELREAYQQLAGRATDADREKVEWLGVAQRDQLDKLQRLELDIARTAVESASRLAEGTTDDQHTALEQLETAVDTIGNLYKQEQDRLVQERAELEQALATADAKQRSALLDGLLESQNAVAGDVWSETEQADRLDAGPLAGMRPAQESADEFEIANTQKRGNIGERLAADWLAENDYEILNYKPRIEDTNKRGIDLVALRDDAVYLVDNKALTRDGNVSSVSALTANLDRNVEDVKQSLIATANELKDHPDELATVRKALDALNEGRYVLAVTNANVTPDDRILSGLTDRLAQQGLTFIDVMNGESGERLRRIADDLTAKGFDLVNAAFDVAELNRQRIDMVAMKDDRVYLIDNNAISPSGELASVAALTRDFEDTESREGNLTKTKRMLDEMVKDATRPVEERAQLGAALLAIEEERYVRAVTTANVSRDASVDEKLAASLREQYRIVLLDLAGLDEARRQHAERLDKESANALLADESREETEGT